MKLVICFLALAACERSPSRDQRPPKPDPTNDPTNDPIKQARSEFELISPDYRVGTSKLYSRGDFLEGPYGKEALDTGAFIGRLRTLFGPQPDNEYVLRHRATGFVITAYSGASGPSYGGAPRYLGALPPTDHLELLPPSDEGVAARRAADPIIAAGDPSRELATDLNELETAALMKRVAVFNRHLRDADAPVGVPPIVARLEALVEAVPPADWEQTSYDEDSSTVNSDGAKAGTSFGRTLEPEAAMMFLLAEAEKPREPTEMLAWSPDLHALVFFQAHESELAAFAPRVRAAWNRIAAEVKASPNDRTALSAALRDLAKPLHLTPAQVAAALP